MSILRLTLKNTVLIKKEYAASVSNNAVFQ